MHHMDQAGFNIGATITAVLPMDHTVYTGDEDGHVVSFPALQDLVDMLTWSVRVGLHTEALIDMILQDDYTHDGSRAIIPRSIEFRHV